MARTIKTGGASGVGWTGGGVMDERWGDWLGSKKNTPGELP